jgi:phage RecT family recombinase
MSTAVTNIGEAGRKASRVEVFMGQVMTPMDRQELQRALPQHVPYARFERNLLNCLMATPKLLDCNPREVFREVSKIAALGLYCDPQLGEAYLIVSKSGPQARVGYRGLMKLGRQSGDVSMFYAHEVHQNDDFECVLGTEKRLTHKPNLMGDRGPIVLYYAVVKYKDGDSDFEPMTIDQINAIRDKSDGYRAFRSGLIKDTPWASAYDEMAKKTVIRRLSKRIPQSPDLSDAFKIEDRAEGSVIEGTVTNLSDRLAALPSSHQTIAESVSANLGEHQSQPAPLQAAKPEGANVPPQPAPSGDPSPRAMAVSEFIEHAGYAATIEALDELFEPMVGLMPELGSADRVAIQNAYENAQARIETATSQAASEPERIPDGDPDFQRGEADFRNGIKRCLVGAIKDDPARLAKWQAGWDAAQSQVEITNV